MQNQMNNVNQYQNSGCEVKEKKKKVKKVKTKKKSSNKDI